ncbi:hypothetical protein PilKf_01815 [Pillotina sp. SPG140]|jgi:hypothetical protein
MDTNSPQEKQNKKQGVIAFLDFLGWKGIWLGDYKKYVGSSVDTFDYGSLNDLAELLKKIKALFEEKIAEKEKRKFISVSDTIAFFTECEKKDYYNFLKLYADICGQVLNLAAESGFALRGAITIGEYATLDNIMVGPGVDECASWHEQTDWLGVIFAPSAQFVIDEEYNKKKNDEKEETKAEGDINTKTPPNQVKKIEKIVWRDGSLIRYDSIPLKGGFKGLKYCVKWGEKPDILNKVLANTVSLPIDVAQKYINTQNYLYELRPQNDTRAGDINAD